MKTFLARLYAQACERAANLASVMIGSVRTEPFILDHVSGGLSPVVFFINKQGNHSTAFFFFMFSLKALANVLHNRECDSLAVCVGHAHLEQAET